MVVAAQTQTRSELSSESTSPETDEKQPIESITRRGGRRAPPGTTTVLEWPKLTPPSNSNSLKNPPFRTPHKEAENYRGGAEVSTGATALRLQIKAERRCRKN